MRPGEWEGRTKSSKHALLLSRVGRGAFSRTKLGGIMQTNYEDALMRVMKGGLEHE